MTHREGKLLLQFITVECRPLKQLTDAMKDSVGDVTMVFTQESIRTTAVDHNQTVIVDLNIETDKLMKYYLSDIIDGKKQPLALGLSINNMNKIIRTAQNNSDDVIEFQYYEGQPHIIIIISSASRGETRIFELPLIENENMFDQKLDSVANEYSYVLTMPCTDYQKICRDLKGTEVDQVKIQYSGYQLSFNGIGGLGGRIFRDCVNIDDGGDDTKQVVVKRKPDSEHAIYNETFKLVSLCNLHKCAQSGTKEVVQICMEPDKPVVFAFNVGSMGKIRFGLAPYSSD